MGRFSGSASQHWSIMEYTESGHSQLVGFGIRYPRSTCSITSRLCIPRNRHLKNIMSTYNKNNTTLEQKLINVMFLIMMEHNKKRARSKFSFKSHKLEIGKTEKAAALHTYR